MTNFFGNSGMNWQLRMVLTVLKCIHYKICFEYWFLSYSYIQPTDQRNKYYAHACTNQILFSLWNIYEWVFILTVAESECDWINNAYPLCYFIRECAVYFFLTILYYITIWNSQLIKCERIFSSFFFY